jgi:ABC-type nitrate/sulfonate/bicarbonate transport system substrate-binding protein
MVAIRSEHLETLEAVITTALNIVKTRPLADLYVRRDYTGEFRIRVQQATLRHRNQRADWLAKDLAHKKGWGPQDVTVVTMGNAPTTIIAAFREHLVDAYINVTSLFLAMEENKTGRVLAPVSQYEGKLAVGTLYASKHLIDTDPNTVRAFIAGWIETIDFIRTHKAETVKIESEITGFSESVMSRDYDLTVGMFTKDCKFDAESLATLKRSFVDLKLLAAPPDMSALYTEAFLPK